MVASSCKSSIKWFFVFGFSHEFVLVSVNSYAASNLILKIIERWDCWERCSKE